MIRMLTSRGLGPRIGGRSAPVEWAVGIVAVLPYWLLLVASFALDEPRLYDFLDAVPAVGVVLPASIVMKEPSMKEKSRISPVPMLALG